VQLPTQPLLALPTLVDGSTPVRLPFFGQPKSERGAGEDPTMEASQAAALRQVRPRRYEPVPFAPVNLPDPFEHIRQGGLRNPPAESDQPPAVPIRTPGR
jgi:hypothetical protein